MGGGGFGSSYISSQKQTNIATETMSFRLIVGSFKDFFLLNKSFFMPVRVLVDSLVSVFVPVPTSTGVLVSVTSSGFNCRTIVLSLAIPFFISSSLARRFIEGSASE